MNNSGIRFTNTSTSTIDMISVSLYDVEGFFVMIINAGLFIRIISISQLRSQKEFAIMAACVLFDTIFGATYFASGIWRTIIYFKFDYIPAKTRWQCFNTPHVYLFTIITPAAGYLLVLTALDRLFCVFAPIKYIKTSVYFCYTVMLLPYILDIPTFVISMIGSSHDSTEYSQNMICLMPAGVPLSLYADMRLIRITCCLLVVVIYIPIGVKMYQILRKHQIQTGVSASTQKKLVKLTATLALLTVNTLVFFTVPDLITYFNPTVPTYVFYLMNLNKGVLNLVAVFFTQKPMRRLIYKSSSKVGMSTIQVKTVTTVIRSFKPSPTTTF